MVCGTLVFIYPPWIRLTGPVVTRTQPSLTHLSPFDHSMVIMFRVGVVALLLVSLVLTSGQETGIGLGTCTYSFVVQSPYCGKDVGGEAEADIQRLQVSGRRTVCLDRLVFT